MSIAIEKAKSLMINLGFEPNSVNGARNLIALGQLEVHIQTAFLQGQEFKNRITEFFMLNSDLIQAPASTPNTIVKPPLSNQMAFGQMIAILKDRQPSGHASVRKNTEQSENVSSYPAINEIVDRSRSEFNKNRDLVLCQTIKVRGKCAVSSTSVSFEYPQLLEVGNKVTDLAGVEYTVIAETQMGKVYTLSSAPTAGTTILTYEHKFESASKFGLLNIVNQYPLIRY